MFAKFLALIATAGLVCLVNPARLAADDTAAEVPADQQAFLDTCKPWDDWDKPAPPFEVYRDTYYVGTCGIASILITDDDGHILIDSGTDAGADVVLDNIASLGFEAENVRFLLISHEHFDHVGGLAKIQEATGGVVVSSEAAKPVLITGETAKDDPQAGMHDAFAGVRVDATVGSGGMVRSGSAIIRAIETPGHSPGALSWAWQKCRERCENIVYADSLSPISRDDYRFGDHPDYVTGYRAGLVELGREGCTILLTPHPSHSRMIRRMAERRLIENAPGARPCKQYAAGKLLDLETRLANEEMAKEKMANGPTSK
ncbi:subclass B3 metallo-beta-lactamase [Erythrobacter crassostreae]|uniref:Subclass B3 metallo-beta-lactamase n=1 Tax=Erythrobacter crassostreae TaxID=2828328 RepID=A0A9X1F4Q8_9SPHN|nr:subclass B3 metallo-beta-lactamase [Erythrobacter crassostrea]MBV7260084.1 subclass B3 metallo-beta-lactamase [Erythrobacter crassostrea]